MAAFRGSGSGYVSCCFVDVFCYVGCVTGSDYRWAFPSDGDGYYASVRQSDVTRHRSRHRHSLTDFRSKRAADESDIWKLILRYKI
ncbi:hypothetical protein DPMN_067357 [Dreissena polymorpha]|uniref:Uncharacterized protein n=1 Tax=Dreissena polymorpha TaxID=45954 RepID=A0A9D3Z053_DREPO|nr:hypothetical protein DPMN_067357 [Dreissena polymorpha]